MRILVVTMTFLIAGQSISQEITTNGMDASCLTNTYFGSLSMTSSNMTLTFKEQGQRYLYSIDDGPLSKSNYGQTLTLKIGNKLRLMGKGSQIEFSALPEKIRNMGFDVRETIERMSVSGAVTTSEWFMIRMPSRDGQRIDSQNSIRLVEPKVETVEKMISKSAP